MSENEEYGLIYPKIMGQVIVGGMGDIIGLNYDALRFVMNLYGIRNQQDCFEKVTYAFNKIMAARRANGE